MRRKYTHSVQVAGKYKQKERETTNQYPKQKTSPYNPEKLQTLQTLG